MQAIRLTLAVVAAVAVAAIACQSTGDKSASDGRVPPNEPWREAKPAPGPVPEFKLPQFQRADLKNGMALYVVEDRGLPMITAAVVVRGGSAQEGPKDAGLASITYDLLDEGAGSMNNLQLANAFASLGTSIETENSREVGIIRVELLKKHAEAGLDLLGTVVKKPSFAAADFDRVRSQAVARVREREGDPAAIAGTVTSSLVFGADHPYGHDEQGSVETLGKLTVAKAKKFWSDHAGPKNAALVLIGDLSLDEAKALGEKHFGKWTGAAKAPKAPADPKMRTGLTVAIVDVPGAPQTAIRVSRAAMARGDPEESAMIVFNEIIGGSFSSRLNLKLREEKGWTYGAFTGSDRRKGKGPFGVFTDVETSTTADAVAEIMAQLDGIKSGVTDDELKRAKEGYVKSMPGWLGLPSTQVGAASMLFGYDLAPDYYAKLVEGVNAVNADAVKKMAERVIVKEDLVVVMVGDKAAIEPKVKEKNLGDVLVVNKDGTKPK
jgi:zinc protease